MGLLIFIIVVGIVWAFIPYMGIEDKTKEEDMKHIEVNYTIEIDKVLLYWQSKLEHIWNDRKKMDEEIEMIDNTISYLKALKSAMSAQIDIVIQDESGKGN